MWKESAWQKSQHAQSTICDSSVSLKSIPLCCCICVFVSGSWARFLLCASKSLHLAERDWPRIFCCLPQFFLGLTGMGPWESRAESMVAFNSLLTHCLWVFKAVRKWHQAAEGQLVDRESAVWTSFTCTGICSKALSFTATMESVNLSMDNILLWCLFLYLPEQMDLRVGYPHGWEGMWYWGARYSALRVSRWIVTPSLGDYAPLFPTLPRSSSEALEQSQGDFRGQWCIMAKRLMCYYTVPISDPLVTNKTVSKVT